MPNLEVTSLFWKVIKIFREGLGHEDFTSESFISGLVKQRKRLERRFYLFNVGCLVAGYLLYVATRSPSGEITAEVTTTILSISTFPLAPYVFSFLSAILYAYSLLNALMAFTVHRFLHETIQRKYQCISPLSMMPESCIAHMDSSHIYSVYIQKSHGKDRLEWFGKYIIYSIVISSCAIMFIETLFLLFTQHSAFCTEIGAHDYVPAGIFFLSMFIVFGTPIGMALAFVFPFVFETVPGGQADESPTAPEDGASGREAEERLTTRAEKNLRLLRINRGLKVSALIAVGLIVAWVLVRVDFGTVDDIGDILIPTLCDFGTH